MPRILAIALALTGLGALASNARPLDKVRKDALTVGIHEQQAKKHVRIAARLRVATDQHESCRQTRAQRPHDSVLQ